MNNKLDQSQRYDIYTYYVLSTDCTRLPQSRAGGQGLYLRAAEYLGRTSRAEIPINAEKVKCDGQTDGRTDRRIDKAGCRFAKLVT